MRRRNRTRLTERLRRFFLRLSTRPAKRNDRNCDGRAIASASAHLRFHSSHDGRAEVSLAASAAYPSRNPLEDEVLAVAMPVDGDEPRSVRDLSSAVVAGIGSHVAAVTKSY